MKTYEIIILKEAENDLASIYRFALALYADKKRAKTYTDQIFESISCLKTFPYAHQERLVGKFAHQAYRQFCSKDYIVIYRVDEEHSKVFVNTILPKRTNL